MNFTRLIRGIAKGFPDNDAVVAGEAVTSFREFWRKIVAVGVIYHHLGVSEGDRILLVLPNSPEFLFFHFAALKIGAISVPVRPEYRYWELKHIIEDCDPRFLISNDAWLGANAYVVNLRSDTCVVSIDQLSYETYHGDDTAHPVNSHAIASINYSYSGDGYPKGAMLTHANHTYAASGYARHQGFRSDDRLMIILPMSHVYALSGCVNSGLIRGGALVIVNQVRPKSIFEAIQRHGVTILSAVPAMFEYLADFPWQNRYDLSSLRLCVTGGDYMPEAPQREFEASLGVEMVQGYGLTECLPIICNPPGSLNKPGTLGIPGRKDIEIRIMGEESEILPVGQIGEIVIHSPTTMKGYYGRPDDTRKVLKGGWLHTGDLGSLDEDGYLHFHGIKKNIFNIYGNKVDPREVRNALLEHPMVQDVEVYAERFGDPDCLIGTTTICTKVVVNDRASLTEDDIREFCKGRVAAYKVPRKINIVEGHRTVPNHQF